ncbi:hypothetical protein EDB86DRAFT_157119 [Lactarius hatsudake]|nr:hypothetical protein EDB86DRAFT_157119 [Lactarius hatsudake]
MGYAQGPKRNARIWHPIRPTSLLPSATTQTYNFLARARLADQVTRPLHRCPVAASRGKIRLRMRRKYARRVGLHALELLSDMREEQRCGGEVVLLLLRISSFLSHRSWFLICGFCITVTHIFALSPSVFREGREARFLSPTHIRTRMRFSHFPLFCVAWVPTLFVSCQRGPQLWLWCYCYACRLFESITLATQALGCGAHSVLFRGDSWVMLDFGAVPRPAVVASRG